MKLRTTIATAATLLLVAAPIASAHITVSADNTSAGGYATLTLNVPHGCDGAATDKVTLKVPEGVTSFTPGRTAFWTPKLTMKTLDEPITSAHGEKITEVPDEVTWTASTPLPDGQLDQISSSIKFPEEEGQLNFPIVQECVGAAETAWTQIAAEGEDEPEHPAPFVTLTAASGDGHGGGTSDEHSEDTAASSDDSGHSDKAMKSLEDDVAMARTIAYIGIGVGALGLLFGLIGISRRKR